MDVPHGSAEASLKTADFAGRDDFDLGLVTVSPSTRTIAGRAGSANLEPRVMQVLLALADAGGRVVSRRALFERCWGAVYVGDDSLNRVIAAIRRIATEIGEDSFAIETVRQTGYRLTIADGASAAGSRRDGHAGARPSRRLLLGAGAAVAAAGIAGGAWLWSRPRSDPRFDSLMDGGLTALRYGDYRTDSRAVRAFKEAVAIRPDSASAWGLLAYSLVNASQSVPGVEAGNTVQDAQRAARNALNLNPNDPDALTAGVLIKRSDQGRTAVEDGLRQILAQTPDHPRAMALLDRLLQGAGRARESWQLNERLIDIEPISPGYMFRRALKLWVFGQSEDAQRASQSTMDLWPTHLLVRMARLLICAFTDRTREALALVEEEAHRPILLSPQGVSVWRASLAALEGRTPSLIASARTANLEGARSSPPLAAYGLIVMSALGELDAAFEIANGFLLARGPVVLERKPGSENLWTAAPWRNTLGLFTPPAAPMRLDPRFKSLCDGLGLTEYWRERGQPDAFLFRGRTAT